MHIFLAYGPDLRFGLTTKRLILDKSARVVTEGDLKVLPIVLGWAFAGLIYFKVAFQAGTSEGTTVLASLLMAAVLGLTVFFASGMYAAKLLAYNWEPGRMRASWGQLVGKTLFWFSMIAFAFVVVSRLIIFGFAEKLSYDIRIFRWDRLNDEFVVFVIIAVVPILVHYLMCLFSTHRNANQPR
ncbi:hypothetical protein NKI56_32050 [Mesorhizobium sp. M0622]|uniref:hypothetical protein n=1 Tax=Mesorhizobium sp. M0622 TaxID=2956975 RepID=UPI003335CA25